MHFHYHLSLPSLLLLLLFKFLLLPGLLAEAPPQQYIDPTFPPAFPVETPACSLLLLQHDFAETLGLPPVTANYTPPHHCRWTRAVLELSVYCAGQQDDRIAAVWINGAEVLRTSTAEPTASGVFWKVRKEVTRYSSLLRRTDQRRRRRGMRDHHQKPFAVVSVMVENAVDGVYTGVFHVNVSLDFYGGGKGSRVGNVGKLGFLDLNDKLGLGLGYWEDKLGLFDGGVDSSRKIAGEVGSSSLSKETISNLYGKPADLIIPISNEKGHNGYWFRIENEPNLLTKTVKIPRNAYRAVMEIFASAHSDDEFWYSNPPNSYIEQNNLPTKSGNGAFRQVFITIDGLYAGSIVPFPVVYTGGINPLFWKPIVAIGTFELPSYDIDLTPFLGNLLNGNNHEFGLGVAESLPFWLVDANLHLWLDPHSSSVTAKLVRYKAPPISITHTAKSKFLDGKFDIEAQRGSHFSGWVRSSLGNLTTLIENEFKFRSSVEFKNNGDVKEVYTKTKFKTDIKTEESPKMVLFRQYHKSKYPIRLIISTFPGEEDGTNLLRTNLSHVMYDKTAITMDRVPSLSSVTNNQNAEGWVEVRDKSVLSGSASSLQTYTHIDQSGCYIRTMSAKDGVILSDQTSIGCTSTS